MWYQGSRRLELEGLRAFALTQGVQPRRGCWTCMRLEDHSSHNSHATCSQALSASLLVFHTDTHTHTVPRYALGRSLTIMMRGVASGPNTVRVCEGVRWPVRWREPTSSTSDPGPAYTSRAPCGMERAGACQWWCCYCGWAADRQHVAGQRGRLRKHTAAATAAQCQ